MSEAAVIAVREETARIGNTKVTKKTAFVATAEGWAKIMTKNPRISVLLLDDIFTYCFARLVAIESHSVEQLNQQPR